MIDIGEHIKEHITVDNRYRQARFLNVIANRYSTQQCRRVQGELVGGIASEVYHKAKKHLWHTMRIEIYGE